jgi:hypothetical protein
MACHELLLTRHRKSLIDYPPPQYSPKNVGRNTAKIHVDQTPINCTLKELCLVWEEMVRYTEHEPLFKSLMDQFHYLWYSQIVGNYFKYMRMQELCPEEASIKRVRKLRTTILKELFNGQDGIDKIEN